MPHTVAYDEGIDAVTIAYSGVVNTEVLKQGAAAAAAVASEQGTRLVLVDVREATLAMSVADFFFLPRVLAAELAEQGLSLHQLRRAVVVARASEAYAFFETVTRNNAQNAKVFCEIEEARRWLAEGN